MVRRMRQEPVYGITFPLITTAKGEKMGKTARGAVWLDAELTSPYEYYQYWINTEDQDVLRFLYYFTFLPIEEIHEITGLQGADLNLVKTILAYEVTSITHGEDGARTAQADSEEIFGARSIPDALLPSSGVRRQPVSKVDAAAGLPTTTVASRRLRQGIPAFELFAEVGLCTSKGEARRLIQQGGGYINGKRISRFDDRATPDHLEKGELLLRAGKKKYHRLRVDEGS